MIMKLTLIFSIFFVITESFSFTKDTILIENVNIIPMTEEIVLTNQRVFISGGKIIRIESSKEPLSYKVNITIDGSEKYLIPGLAEMHYHYRSDNIESDLKLLLANGITTVRNMAEFNGQDHMTIKERISTGDLLGPNYFTTGPYLTANNFLTIRDVESTVEDHKKKGYDFLKLADNLPLPIYLKLIEECQKHNLKIIGHAQRDLPLEFSMRMNSIEHIEEFLYLKENNSKKELYKYSDQELKNLAIKLRNSGIYIGTTLTVFDFINKCLNDSTFTAFKDDELLKYLAPDQRNVWLSEKNDYRKLKEKEFNGVKAPVLFKEYFNWMKKFTKVLFQNQVSMLTGSDTYGMVIVGFSLSKEFSFLQDAGVKPYQILLASTVVPARYLGRYGVQGTVTVGKNADLVLLGKNPLEDIQNINSIEGVIAKGKWIDRTNISKMLKEVEESFN